MVVVGIFSFVEKFMRRSLFLLGPNAYLHAHYLTDVMELVRDSYLVLFCILSSFPRNIFHYKYARCPEAIGFARAVCSRPSSPDMSTAKHAAIFSERRFAAHLPVEQPDSQYAGEEMVMFAVFCRQGLDLSPTCLCPGPCTIV